LQDIESFLERGVFLELGVALSERWRENKDALEKFGYFDPMLV
jgi:GTP-binding protein Era